MKKTLLLTSVISAIILTLPGCEAIGTIFKAGMWSGIIIVVFIIFLIILLITKVTKKK